ncbi:MAG TPA: peptidylprolyl isomerase [Candidatus Limnocylindria bacterium]|nr:peptidylprolyl isomerase [Candidatus Limnocylindria bacterium]
MFGTIRRHQKWLLFVVVILVIISFVIYFDPSLSSNRGSGDSAPKALELNGKKVTQKMLKDAAREVRLIYFLNTRKWPEEDENAKQNGFDLTDEAYLRLFRGAKAEEAGIRVADIIVAENAKRFLGDYPLERFEKEVLIPNQLTAEDYLRFIHNEAANQQLMAVVGAAGRLVTPAEAEALYRRDHQEVSGDIVFFHLTNYLDKVVITNGALTNFYAQRPVRVPDKVRVSYVEFSRSNFLADVDKQMEAMTNLAAALRESYYKAGASNFKDTNGVVLSESNAIARIKENERQRGAMMFAARKANEFANQLYDKQPVTVETFEKLAATNDLPLQVSLPFDHDDGPTNLNVSGKFAEIAFTLDPVANPISFTPVDGENGYYLMAIKEKIPGRFEPFEAVKDKVAEDYKRYSAFTLAYADATNFVGKATNLLAQSKTFEEAALGSKLKVETLPPISRSTESVTNLDEQIDIRRLKSVLLSLEANKVSGFNPNPPDGGYVVYARAKLPFDDAKMSAELPKFLAELRYRKQAEIFNRWFSKEVEMAKLPLPGRAKRTGAPGPS